MTPIFFVRGVLVTVSLYSIGTVTNTPFTGVAPELMERPAPLSDWFVGTLIMSDMGSQH